MNIIKLLNGVTATGDGKIIALDPKRVINGPVAFQLSGITTATVILLSTIATQQEVDEETAVWTTLKSGTFTSDTAECIIVSFPFLKANVSAYTVGTITAKIWL